MLNVDNFFTVESALATMPSFLGFQLLGYFDKFVIHINHKILIIL